MIDIRKVRTLGSLLLKLETRSKSGTNRKLLLLNISYLIPGILLPWILTKQNTDPSGFEFIFVSYFFFTLIILFTIITELDNLIISGSESEIFSSMPIDDPLLVNAKMYMFLRYSFFLTSPLLVPGSVYFYFMMKSLPRAFLYFASGFLLIFFLINILILLYSAALRIFKSKRLSSYALAFQLFMILSLIFGYQFIALVMTGSQSTGITEYLSLLKKTGFIDYFPQAWYALLPSRNNYVPGFELMFKVFLPILICYLSYFSLKMYLAENYRFIREKFQDSRTFGVLSGGRQRSLIFQIVSDFIQNVYLKNNIERSSYGLVSSLYKKEKSVRLAILPMILIPIALAFFALVTNQLPVPLQSQFGVTEKPVFHISILIAVLISINTAMMSIKVTNYKGVCWIYDSYPVEPFKHFKNGFRKFFVTNMLVPICILLEIIFILKIPLPIATIHTLFIFISANLYVSIYSLLSKGLPFTKENTMLNSLQRMTGIIYPILYGIAIVFIQMYAYKNIVNAIIVILAFIKITLWLNYFGFVRDGVRKVSQ
ncbi:MAG: hypothetical protein L0Y79_12275 [Chlorobi bacterium]|nr:hypothetical protein [Chlorobiota bacterium]MCI0715645.1 hypothetical protein [Chlorobiota bacterium]